MTLAEIQSRIPHRAPMLLIDEIVSETESTIVCRKTFHADEYFFQGHYPGYPLVPGVILCEAAMQGGALLLSKFATGENGVPVAGRMNDVKFKKMIRPGDTIEIEATLVERMVDAFFLNAKVSCQGKVAVRFEFVCTLAKVE